MWNIQGLKHIVKCLGARSSTRSGQWLNFSCVYAPYNHSGKDEHFSAGIHIEKLWYNCFACQVHKPLYDVCCDVLKLYKGNPQYNASEAITCLEQIESCIYFPDDLQKQQRIIWDRKFLDQFPTAYKHKKVARYLTFRNVSYDIAQKIDFRFDYKLSRICVPLFDHRHDLVGFHGRRIGQNSAFPVWFAYNFGGYNITAYLGENFIDWNKPVVVAESVFDLARIMHVYKNVVSPLSASIGKEKIQILAPAYEIITAFDNDAAGDLARKKCEKYLPHHTIKHAFPSTDFGDMTNKQIYEVLKKVM